MAASQPRTQHSRPFIVAVFVFVRCIDTCYALLLKFFTSGAAGHSTGALVFGLYRNALAVPLLWLAARVLEPKAPWLPTAADAPAVLLLAGSAVAVTQIFYLQGAVQTEGSRLAEGS